MRATFARSPSASDIASATSRTSIGKFSVMRERGEIERTDGIGLSLDDSVAVCSHVPLPTLVSGRQSIGSVNTYPLCQPRNLQQDTEGTYQSTDNRKVSTLAPSVLIRSPSRYGLKLTDDVPDAVHCGPSPALHEIPSDNPRPSPGPPRPLSPHLSSPSRLPDPLPSCSTAYCALVTGYHPSHHHHDPRRSCSLVSCSCSLVRSPSAPQSRFDRAN